MAKLYLLGSIGYPGSGKSTFFTRFSQERGLLHWQNDEVRRRLFAHPEHNRAENQQLNRVAYYALGQSLGAGISAIFDVNLNRHEHRQHLTALARRYGAEFCLLWFQVPLEVAQERSRLRAEQATGELKDYYDTFDPDFVKRMSARLQHPGPDEPVIIIDGKASYEDQRQTVLSRLEF